VRTGAVLGAWLVVGLAVWSGFFELYVSRGAREFLQRQAESELGRSALPPSMQIVMRDARRDGAIGATGWAGLVVVGGFVLYGLGYRAGTRRAALPGPAAPDRS